MTKKVFGYIVCALLFGHINAQNITLKEAFKDKFLIGAALNTWQVNSDDYQIRNIIDNEFSAIVAENCMKSMYIQPQEGKFNFNQADQFVDLGERNGQFVVGHCLIWHSQLPRWFLIDSLGNTVSAELLKNRIINHVTTVVKRYKGRVKGWDVVNEAVENNGEMRQSPFYRILGEAFIEIAFKAAHEADPDAELYYNDYSLHIPEKRNAVINLVKRLKDRGCKIDAIGMQSHMDFDVSLEEYEKSIEAFASIGCKVMATELDVSPLPSPKGNFGAAVETEVEYQEILNPYVNGLSEEAEKQLTDYFCNLFDIYLKHADVITRVNFWGVTDADSWKNNFPIRGRTDYPLAFDRMKQPKPFVKIIKQMAINR